MHPIIWIIGAVGALTAFRQVQKKAPKPPKKPLGDYNLTPAPSTGSRPPMARPVVYQEQIGGLNLSDLVDPEVLL